MGRRWLYDISSQWFPFASNGWWNCLARGDFDNDGDADIIVGNQGLNSQLKADENHPMLLYYTDIDGNGSIDPIITYFNGTENALLPFRDDLLNQVPVLKKKFNDYPSYAKATIKEIIDSTRLSSTPKSKITTSNKLTSKSLRHSSLE